jgi:predicted DNA-binding protein (MmcQ/YjbR family)
MAGELQQVAATLRAFALGLPATYEDFPWGESVLKVNKKIFLFLGIIAEQDKRLYVGVKLPQTSMFALTLPFVKPSAYGLGKHGWVSAEFAPEDNPPVDLLLEWVEESYRAIALKRLVAELDQRTVP